MTEEKVSPLLQRMIEDMRIRGMGNKAQRSHIRAIKDFAAFLAIHRIGGVARLPASYD